MKTNTQFCSNLTQFFTDCLMFQRKWVEKIKPHISCSAIFLKNYAIYEMCKILHSQTGHRWPYDVGAFLHAGNQELQTQTQNTHYLLLFHCNNGCTNAPQCYITRTVLTQVRIFTPMPKVVINTKPLKMSLQASNMVGCENGLKRTVSCIWW
jgi:hypothetical protein